jgi:hypothetical protein
MKDQEKVADEQSLLGFLTHEPSSQAIHVTVSGHSLGGALAPVLALWLENNRGSWDGSGKSTLTVYTFAGTTPGNKAYADYLNSLFIGDSLVVINNTLDIVPHAWNLNTMDEIPHLYGSDIPLCGVLADLYYTYLRPRAGLEYTRLGKPEQQQSFTGQLLKHCQLEFDPCLLLLGVPEESGKLMDFGMEAVYQHVCAYPKQLHLKYLVFQEGLCRLAHPYP